MLFSMACENIAINVLNTRERAVGAVGARIY